MSISYFLWQLGRYTAISTEVCIRQIETELLFQIIPDSIWIQNRYKEPNSEMRRLQKPCRLRNYNSAIGNLVTKLIYIHINRFRLDFIKRIETSMQLEGTSYGTHGPLNRASPVLYSCPGPVRNSKPVSSCESVFHAFSPLYSRHSFYSNERENLAASLSLPRNFEIS
jgi:hypothetical protein